MPYASPSSSTVVTPVMSPQVTRINATSHWGQPVSSSDGHGLPLRRHSRSSSHDSLNALSPPPPPTQIFLQPASPVDGIGPVPPSSAAAALNASIEHPPQPVSPRSSPSAQRLKLSPTLSEGKESCASETTEWPEGDPHEPSSPVASTSALPEANGSRHVRAASEPNGAGEAQRRPSPPRLHLRGAAARSRTSPTVPLSALKKSVEKLAAQQRASTPAIAVPMIRKKSGELVRSSLKGHSTSSSRLSSYEDSELSLSVESSTSHSGGISPSGTRETRSKSVPATPMERKHVLFDDNLEHIKLFRSEQRPTAVSRTGSPTETETEEESEGFPFPAMSTISGKIIIRCPDLPAGPLSDQDHRDVALEKLEMSVDMRNLRGAVQVRNIALHKRVVVRFTTDDWQTVSETACEYVTGARGGAFDRWGFTIKLQDLLARIESTRLLLVIRYNCDGRELWDNNHHRNYCIQFKRDVVSVTRKQAASSIRSAQTERYKFAMDNPDGAQERMAYLKRELDRLVIEADDNISPPMISSSPSNLAQRYDFSTSFKKKNVRSMPPPTLSPSSALMSNPFFHPLSGGESPSSSPLMSPAASSVGTNFPSVHQPAVTGPSQPLHMRRDSNGVVARDYGLPAHVLEPFPPQRMQTPPDEDSRGPHSPYLRDSEDYNPSTPRSNGRFNSFPPVNHPKADYISLLLAPRPTKGSPPAGSPMETPSETPSESESTTPQSDGAQSPPQLRGSFSDLPGLVSEQREKADGTFSPSNSSLDTVQSSPESPESGSPPSSTHSPDSTLHLSRGLVEDAPSYSSFLQKYCWHNSSQPSALGLTDVPRQLTQPAPLRLNTPSFFLGSTAGPNSPIDETHGLYSRHRDAQRTPLADARG